MSVFRELTINWQGNDYQVVPTMRLMRQIESNGVSLTDVAHRTSKGQAPLSHIAYILSALLTDGGATHCSEDEVYETLIEGKPSTTTRLVMHVLEAFSPGDDDSGKKPESRASTSSRKSSKKNQPATG